MKKAVNVLTSLIFLLGICVAAPALAQERGWSYVGQERLNGEGYFADLGITRAQGVETAETLLLARWDSGDQFWITADAWNMEAIHPNNNFERCLVHETDLEVEAGWRDLVGPIDLRAKGALYELCGDDIYSLRVAADYPLWGPFSATTSVEAMTGLTELAVVKPLTVSVSETWRDWSFSGDIGPAYNTLAGGNWNWPWSLHVDRTLGPVSIGAFYRGYSFGENEDSTGGLQLVIHH